MSDIYQQPDKKINRKPHEDVKHQLRKEVLFSCPIRNRSNSGRCGSPYLTWHHFDPPWNVKNHHDLRGMIALCQIHHDQADGGAYTVEQLRNLKQIYKGQNVNINTEQAKIGWMRNDLLVAGGGGFYYKTPFLIQYENKQVIWFERDEQGYLLLNIDLSPITDKTRLNMTDNYWGENIGNPTDFECPPSGKQIRATYDNGDTLMIHFSEIKTENQFRSRFKAVQQYTQKRDQEMQKQIQQRMQKAQQSLQKLNNISPFPIENPFESYNITLSDFLGDVLKTVSLPVTVVEIHLAIEGLNITLGPKTTITKDKSFINFLHVGGDTAFAIEKNGQLKIGIAKKPDANIAEHLQNCKF